MNAIKVGDKVMCSTGVELGKFLSDNSEVVELMNNCHEDFWNALKDCRVIGNIYDNPDLLNPQN